jgi:hypothetical protein
MGWSTGTFTLTTAGLPYVTGTTISSTVANNLNTELQTGINQAVNKDGSNAWTANLNAAGFKVLSLGAATLVSDAARASQVQNSAMNVLASVAGATTITGNASPTPAAYVEGQTFSFIAVGANGAGATLNVSSIGAVPLFWAGVTCTASMWSTGNRIDATYISTSSQTGFHIMGHSGFMPINMVQVGTDVPQKLLGSSAIANALGADVNLNATATFFDGPVVAQGTVGTWYVSGKVTFVDAAGAAAFFIKLWDGTTVVDSATITTPAAGFNCSATLGGVISSPAGNLKISVRDIGSTNGLIIFNNSGSAKDSTITAIRIG